MSYSLGGNVSMVSGQRANPHKDSANTVCYIYYKQVIYLSGKVSCRLRETYSIKKNTRQSQFYNSICFRKGRKSISYSEGRGGVMSP